MLQLSKKLPTSSNPRRPISPRATPSRQIPRRSTLPDATTTVPSCGSQAVAPEMAFVDSRLRNVRSWQIRRRVGAETFQSRAEQSRASADGELAARGREGSLDGWLREDCGVRRQGWGTTWVRSFMRGLESASRLWSAGMAVFSVAAFTSPCFSGALHSSKPWQLHALSCACDGALHVQPLRTERHRVPVVVSATAGQPHQRAVCSEYSQTRARVSGTARAVGEPSVVANLADGPQALEERSSSEEEGAEFIQGALGALRGEHEFENGSLSLEEMEAEKGDENGVELSEEAGENGAISPAALQREVSRRRNFAIISHPDAGKTTLTEKLLLYGGAIHEAGAVKARRSARHATSDWMDLEKQRGISITSTALVFENRGFQITLLDTPGHQDFGEDTYRTLAAADNAVMLVDAGKGLEPQTRKLFEVCRMRKLPIFTFINKMDRPALEPLELMDQIEKEFNLPTYPVNWPIGSGDRFVGVYYRPRNEVHLFEKGTKHGSQGASVRILPWGDPALQDIIADELFQQLQEEIELLEELTPPLDMAKIHSGDISPVYFGSAMNNFGVELFLESFLEYSVQPGKHVSDLGEVEPEYPNFTGFVFKLQANMDAKHRDKVAFVRVCSGQFVKGMKVQIARNGKTLALTRPQKMFAQDRTTMETAYAGDVVGLNNPNAFCIGDTIYAGPKRVFPGIPSFSPELFCYMRNPNPSKYKQFVKGLNELLGEGAVQVLYSVDSGRTDPILAAVGQLQFEVVQYRMQAEYGVETQLEPLGFSVARWVNGGWPALEKVGRIFNCSTVKDQWGRPVLLFRNDWNVTQLLGDHPEIGELAPYALPPEEIISKR